MVRKTYAFAMAAATIAAASFVSSGASARPENAAQVGSGTGCLVSDAYGTYYSDPSCTWQTVTKRDADGQLQMYMYHDHGQLPEGAPAPQTAQRQDVSFANYDCDEITTPSGEYQSSCTIRP